MTPKMLGFDIELGTCGVKPNGEPMQNWSATGDVLRALPEVMEQWGVKLWSRAYRTSWGSKPGRHTTDWMRNWMSNGFCLYGDLGHVEGAAPLTRYPQKYAEQIIAFLRMAESARRQAELYAEPGTKFDLTAHNCDHTDPGISWGHHFNLSISKELWENLFVDPRRPAVLGFMASGLAAAVPFFGAGNLLLLKNGKRRYSLSSRIHHLNHLMTRETTLAWSRGLLNSRREAHATEVERLHTISLDASPLCAVLRASFMQCLATAAEHGYARCNLLDPVDAASAFSYGLSLQSGKMTGMAATTDGRVVSLPEFMREITTDLLQMVEEGLISPEQAPNAGEYLTKIIELTHHIENGDLGAAFKHLDWAAKLMMLLDLQSQHGCGLEDPRLVLADQDFTNTDPNRSGFFRLWEAGVIDPMITEEGVENSLREPPEESRDWGRSKLIEKFADCEEAGQILRVNWDEIELGYDGYYWTRRLKIEFPDVETHNKASFEKMIDQINDIQDLEEWLAHHRRQETNQKSFLLDDEQADPYDPFSGVGFVS